MQGVTTTLGRVGAWIWRGIKVVVVVAIVGFIGLVIYRYPIVIERQKSDAMVEKIRAAKLTMADVDGSHLPAIPDPKAVDATVEGVDANENGIRDDVELAIFKKYPGAANLKLRAAELQYAKALQATFSAFTEDTLSAAAWEQSRGYSCISHVNPELPLTATESELQADSQISKARINEVRSLVLNTKDRQSEFESLYEKFMSSHKSPSTDYCDL